jgi:PmbA protein
MMDLAERIVEAAGRAGASAAEAFASSRARFRVTYRGRELDAVSVAEEGGFALRLIVDGKTGFSTSSSLEDAGGGIGRLVEQGLASARLGDDPALELPGQPDALPEVEGLFDPGLAARSAREKRDLVESQVEAAFGHSPRVSGIRAATYSESSGVAVLANSAGMRLLKRGTACSLSASVMATEGDQSETGHEWRGCRRFEQLASADVGEAAARLAVSMLGGRPVRTGRYDVVFDPMAAASLLEAFSRGISGPMVARGKSPLAGMLGQRVGTERFTLVDDPLLPGGYASEPFDDEGVPRRRAVLVDRGVLSAFLLDLKSASLMGAVSTGSAARGDYRSTPSVAPANFHVAPPDPGGDALLGRLGKGLLINDLMGAHTIDPVSGSFSLGASGFVVEAGRVGRPFRGVTMAGSLYEIFHRLVDAGDDLRFFGEVGSPSLLVEGVDIAGEGD